MEAHLMSSDCESGKKPIRTTKPARHSFLYKAFSTLKIKSYGNETAENILLIQ